MMIRRYIRRIPDPKPVEKYTVKANHWYDGILRVVELVFDSLEEAIEHLTGEDDYESGSIHDHEGRCVHKRDRHCHHHHPYA